MDEANSVCALYALHSGQLYGTERMALATLECMPPGVRRVVVAPPGPVHAEAAALGIETLVFSSAGELYRAIRSVVCRSASVAFFATGVVHSLAYVAATRLRRSSHLHVVHGGTDERLSYGRKRWLQHLPVRFVAVSNFVRERLAVHGVSPRRIAVAENFLSRRRVSELRRRRSFEGDGVRRVIVVSRVDPIKRVGLLLDAIERFPELRSLQFDIYGAGEELTALRDRASGRSNVLFHGFCPDVGGRYAQADLLLHLCPVEPFGLAVLEAFAAGLPVLVPDSGGASSLVEPEVSGFRFRADDATDLARALMAIVDLSEAQLDEVVAAADRRFAERYSQRAGGAAYRALLEMK